VVGGLNEAEAMNIQTIAKTFRLQAKL